MKASDIAQFLDTTLLGKDIEIDGFAELSDIKPHKILFAKKFTPETAQRLSNCADIVAIVPADYLNQLTCSKSLICQLRIFIALSFDNHDKTSNFGNPLP